MSKYLYDDEDNVPMNEENFPQRPERDCSNCRFKVNGDCTQWECNFTPTQYVIEEVQEWLARTSSAGTGHGAK